MKEFRIREINGDKPVIEWLAETIEKFVKEKYGLEIKIQITDQSSNSMVTISNTPFNIEGVFFVGFPEHAVWCQARITQF